jgi:hypothetical protein
LFEANRYGIGGVRVVDTEDFESLEPVTPPSYEGRLTNQQILLGKPLDPLEIIKVYSDDDWEQFIREWVEGLKDHYVEVRRASGAGDKGRDVIGYVQAMNYPYAPGEPLPKGTRLIQLTDSAEEAARAVVGESILCDPGRACATLVELLPVTTRRAHEPVAPSPEPKVDKIITADHVYLIEEKISRLRNSSLTLELNDSQ